ncbi:hypothetical protein GGI07_005381 [Coemansia sp. Benny D115]|nr:hypothetical protein GGI07_005381 [Coemansia sp. Benny D115]
MQVSSVATILGVLASAPLGALAKSSSSDSGIEFVRACDSGPDDVTNQCINRIPEDIGMNSGNHACAYHEAEVKCLGLCGNTVTWKVAYNNALKRYRLVCASYIDERLAEKEENGDAEDSTPVKKRPVEKKADSGDSSENNVSPPKAEKKQQKPSSSAKNTSSAAGKKDGKDQQQKKTLASSQTVSSAEKPASLSSSHMAAKDKHGEGMDKSKDADEERARRGQAVLPTMDPEMAAAPGLKAISSAWPLVCLLAAFF